MELTRSFGNTVRSFPHKSRWGHVDCCIPIQKVVSNTYTVMLNAKSQNPGVVSLQKLCDGLGITLRQFFDDELFDNIEQEIK